MNKSWIGLLGGNKAENWDKWYKESIGRAEEIYANHLATLEIAVSA